jgi:hypothetical protein
MQTTPPLFQVAYLTAERDGLQQLVADYEAQREVRV